MPEKTEPQLNVLSQDDIDSIFGGKDKSSNQDAIPTKNDDIISQNDIDSLLKAPHEVTQNSIVKSSI